MKFVFKLFFLSCIFLSKFCNVSAQEYIIQTSQTQNLGSYISRYLAKYDFNNDGLEDLLVGGDNWKTTEKTKIILLINKGDGTFVDSTQNYISGTMLSNDPVSTSADYNNDGVLDVAIFDAGNQELGQDPVLTGYRGEEAILILSQSGKRKWIVSDVLAEVISKVTNFDTSRKLHLKYATSGDINNDGLVDILVESGGGYKQPLTHFYINQGNGKFVADTYRIPQKVLEGPLGKWRYSKNILVDVNNDGFKDIVLGQPRRKDNGQEDLNSIVLINDKSGNFSASSLIILPRADYNKTWNYVRGMLTLDLDKDGFQDLIFSLCRAGTSDSKYPMSGTSFQILINVGGKEFIDKTTKYIQNNLDLEAEFNTIYGTDNKNEPKDLLFVDVDNDGFKDIFMAQSWDPASKFMPIILLNDGKNFFSPINSDLINQGRKYVASLAFPIDVNKDGVLDIVSLSTRPGKDNTYGTADDVMDLIPLFGNSTNPNGDDDKDGVINRNDACRSTPTGVKVDSKGCEIILGIKLEDDFFDISPNPFPSEIKVKFPMEFGKTAQVKIVDMSGNVQFKKASVIDGEQIDLANLNGGNYILHLNSNDNLSSKAIKISKIH